MSEQLQVEPLGDHDYLVRARHSGGVIESRFQASPAILDQLQLPETDEQRVVEETAVFLAERQPIIDFPQMVDLEDVATAYGDYLDEMSHRLTTR
jgi:hypothetical protein